MLKKILSIIYFLPMLLAGACAQVPEERPLVLNPDFDKKISGLIRFSVPVVSPQQVLDMQNHTAVVLLDAREQAEYDTSHLPDARLVGYKNFDLSSVQNLDKHTPIVVYCSIGYRSEKIGEQLQTAGYTQVYNLYGSIFEWVNQGCVVVDSQGRPTNTVHGYSKKWSQWIDPQQAQAVW